MSQTHPIELPEETFLALLRIAEQKGMTPADWIASQIPAALLERDERPLSDVIDKIIGTVDSSIESRPQGHFSSVSDLIAEKFRKQGLVIP